MQVSERSLHQRHRDETSRKGSRYRLDVQRKRHQSPRAEKTRHQATITRPIRGASTFSPASGSGVFRCSFGISGKERRARATPTAVEVERLSVWRARLARGGERIQRLQPPDSGQAGGAARRARVTLPDYGHIGLKGGVAPVCPGVHAARGPTNRLRSPRNHAATPTQLDVHPCHARNGPTIALATGETESIGPRGAEPNPSAGAPPARGSAPVTSTEALPRPWF